MQFLFPLIVIEPSLLLLSKQRQQNENDVPKSNGKAIYFNCFRFTPANPSANSTSLIRRSERGGGRYFAVNFSRTLIPNEVMSDNMLHHLYGMVQAADIVIGR